MGRGAAIALAAAAAAAVSGCAPKYADLKAFVQAHDHDVAASKYRIEPPDVIAITCPMAPEIDGAAQRLGSDGKVTLKLLGPVKVSTLTPREAAAKLEQLLSRYYVAPKVHVRVVSSESKKIYVLGQVAGAGPKPFTGRDTLLDVLAKAQPNFIAWGSRVKVIRSNAKPGEIREITVDVDKMMQKGDLRGNVLLQEGDIVYVPPSPLGWLGLRIQEALFPFSPMFSAYTFPADVATAPKAYEDLDDRGYYGGRGGYGYGGIGSYGSSGW